VDTHVYRVQTPKGEYPYEKTGARLVVNEIIFVPIGDVTVKEIVQQPERWVRNRPGGTNDRFASRLVPTALDNGQRSPRKLLASLVRRLLLTLRPRA